MKLLIVGSNMHWAIERYYVKYLAQFGAQVIHYPANDIVYAYHSKNIFNKILFKSKIRTGYREVNDGLLAKAQEFRPDIIWVFKGMEIYPATWVSLKRQGFTLVNFNPDHPFIITSPGSGNKNVTDSVGLFDLHFCYHHQLQREIENQYHIPTIFLPFAYESTDLSYTEPAEVPEIKKVCFQGNPDAYREDSLSLLASNGFAIDVFGSGWQHTRLVRYPGVQLFGIASRPEFWKKNQEYRLQLNLFRQYNSGSHNMRTFEIPAVGGIQLTAYSDEQAEFFREDQEIFFFRKQDDLLGKIAQILEMPVTRIDSVRAAARKRSMESGYSFADRARTVFNTFQQLL